MLSVSARVPILPSESTACTVNDATPLAVGVPLITPALALSARPAGSAPTAS